MTSLISILIALLLSVSGGGYWYVDKLLQENKEQYSSIQVLEATVINQQEVEKELRSDAELQVNSLLDSFITLSDKYEKVEEKRNELIKQVGKYTLDISNEKNSVIATDIINDGTNLLLKQFEELTSKYYSSKDDRNRVKDNKEFTEAETDNNEPSILDGF